MLSFRRVFFTIIHTIFLLISASSTASIRADPSILPTGRQIKLRGHRIAPQREIDATYSVTHKQCWPPKPIWGSVECRITDRRMSSVIGYLTQIAETETEHLPAGYSVVFFVRNKRICSATFAPLRETNLIFECASAGTSGALP